MDFSNSVELNVIGNEIGEAIIGQPPSQDYKPNNLFKDISLLIRAKVDNYQGRRKMQFTPVRSYSNLGLDYPYRDDNFMLL